MTDSDDTRDARAVADALQRFLDRIDEIMDLIGEKKALSRDEKERAQELLRSLKADLKRAAHDGMVEKRRGNATYFERDFFQPAVWHASVNLRVAVNSHPLASNWYSALYGIRIDISHPLANLVQAFPL